MSEDVGGDWACAGRVSECVAVDGLVNESVLLTH